MERSKYYQHEMFPRKDIYPALDVPVTAFLRTALPPDVLKVGRDIATELQADELSVLTPSSGMHTRTIIMRDPHTERSKDHVFTLYAPQVAPLSGNKKETIICTVSSDYNERSHPVRFASLRMAREDSNSPWQIVHGIARYSSHDVQAHTEEPQTVFWRNVIFGLNAEGRWDFTDRRHFQGVHREPEQWLRRIPENISWQSVLLDDFEDNHKYLNVRRWNENPLKSLAIKYSYYMPPYDTTIPKNITIGVDYPRIILERRMKQIVFPQDQDIAGDQQLVYLESEPKGLLLNMLETGQLTEESLLRNAGLPPDAASSRERLRSEIDRLIHGTFAEVRPHAATSASIPKILGNEST